MKSDKELISEYRSLWIAINVDDNFNEFHLRDIALVGDELETRGYTKDPDYPTKWEVIE